MRWGPIAKSHECSPAQVALAWILSKPFVASVLMGAKRIDQLKDNLAAIHLKLTQEELKSLDEASQLPLEYPEWMLATQGADRLGPVDLASQSVNQKYAAVQFSQRPSTAGRSPLGRFRDRKLKSDNERLTFPCGQLRRFRYSHFSYGIHITI